ncbi:copper amine oxidase-like protein [Paenibacillus taihuensis]|uniref:Copper amine oxidase-like protein n=1 Tax=Paenibacillus taihuensis TaxID=1156355 RepID=A0A3D9RI13_9BACL|nr:copper amine oxidase N-terminal domain-containing protein [Paenibacillus taihuensis]REE78748.1 copper amine oxidase-like protein [Paenibacillus taihuensis]
MRGRLEDMVGRWTRRVLLAASLFVVLGNATVSMAASSGTFVESGTSRLTGNGTPMLDPGFGYYTHFTSALAQQLYKKSPVTAYLPTRLPDSGWQYYGIQSQLTGDGYKLTAYRSAKAVPVEAMLLGAGEAAGAGPAVAASDVLYRLAAGNAAEAGLAVPASAQQLGSSEAGWKFWGDGLDAALATRLSDKFAAMVKPGAPVNGATGTVLVSAAAGGKVIYSASWTNDGSTYYSFVSYGSLDDFISMLTSFRPVLNLLDSADIVLLPVDMQLELQAGRSNMFVTYENRFAPLAKAPLMKNGVAYLPLRDIATIIGGQIQFVAGGAVYVSQNGWLNELKLQLRTGEVFRGQEKLATVPLIVQEGTTLVPLRFMTEQFGLPVTYNAATKTITVRYTHWDTNSVVPQVSDTADYKTSVLSIGGPAFTYYNDRLGPGTGWSYEGHKPPLGYNGLKYQIYGVGVNLLPGENAFVMRDMQTKRVINSIPLKTTLTASDVPFRMMGPVVTDGLKIKMKLTSSNGKAWPAGYAEISDGAAVDVAGEFQGFSYDSVQIGYRIGSLESKRVDVPVKDGKFTYRLTPNKGPGTYEVMVYSPPGSVPGMGGDAVAELVSFVVVTNR